MSSEILVFQIPKHDNWESTCRLEYRLVDSVSNLTWGFSSQLKTNLTIFITIQIQHQCSNQFDNFYYNSHWVNHIFVNFQVFFLTSNINKFKLIIYVWFWSSTSFIFNIVWYSTMVDYFTPNQFFVNFQAFLLTSEIVEGTDPNVFIFFDSFSCLRFQMINKRS